MSVLVSGTVFFKPAARHESALQRPLARMYHARMGTKHSCVFFFIFVYENSELRVSVSFALLCTANVLTNV